MAVLAALPLGGCGSAEQGPEGVHVLRVPVVYPWQAAPLGSGRSFPALGKALATIGAGRSAEIALDFPLHPAGFPYPQGVGSCGTIKIRRGSVRFVAGDAYLTLLPGKRLLCTPTKDGAELKLRYAAGSEYQIAIEAGTLSAGGTVDEEGESAWDKSGITLSRAEHGDWVRVRFQVECSYDFDGDLGQWGVSQEE